MNVLRSIIIVLVLLATVNLASALEEGKDYKCTDKTDAKSPPVLPTVNIDKSIQKVSLCSEGKVPKAIIKDNVKGSESITIFTNTSDHKSEKETAMCGGGYCYNYANSRQFVDSVGAEVYFTQHNPEIDSSYGIYSDAIEAICDSNGNTWLEDCVSIGWRKNKYDVPRLVMGWRNDGIDSSAYSGDYFVQTSSYYYPNMPLGTTNYGVQYLLEYSGGNWWLAYNGEWLGYYPGYVWNNYFTQGDLISDQGSVKTTIPITTTDMGNGLWASNPYSARIELQKYKSPYSYYWYDMYTEKYTTDSTLYTIYPTSSNSMRYGGPGSSGNSIIVTSPNGGENWVRGTTKQIKWSYTGSPGNVRIELLKGGYLNNVISWSASNTGSYSWYIPVAQATGNDYKIRVKSVAYATITDTSNNNFIISSTSGPSITVLSPNGGESWARGSTKLITWTYTGSPGANVKIELYKAGILKSTISSYTANDGSQYWTIPWSLPIGTDYKIKITSTSSVYNDWSNNYFKIY